MSVDGYLLSNAIPLLTKVISGAIPLAEVGDVSATTTAAEADEYGEYLVNRATKNSFRVLNTGTIDPYTSLWGIRTMTHQHEKYETPHLPASRISARRRNMYGSPKVIFAKMARVCEAFADFRGEYASLNTNCFYNPKDEISLEYVCGFCNSKLFMFIYRQYFGALRMSGGYFQFQAPQLRVIPIRVITVRKQKPFIRLVRFIAESIERNESARDDSVLQAIDRLDELFYELYELEETEIAMVNAD